MNENIGDKLSKMLSGIDSAKFKNSVDAVSRLLATEEGRKLKDSLSDSEKKAIIEKFMRMDSGEVNRKLKNADISGISKMSAEDIMKKLK